MKELIGLVPLEQPLEHLLLETVTQAGWMNGYGYCVTISHANGMSTRYGHMSKISVSVGQSVSQGETIGYSGNTGRSTGPHYILRYE